MSHKAQLNGTKAERRIFALDTDLAFPLTQLLYQANTTAAEEPAPWWSALWALTAVSQLLLQAHTAWRRFKKWVISDSMDYQNKN